MPTANWFIRGITVIDPFALKKHKHGFQAVVPTARGNNALSVA